ncbi:GGDEF domain-containing protein [Thiobacillus sp. 65-1402]|uniref:GGDEF domain-containing protein n=1 Tax=Thiobacillus sp. 65-1402 TaxID=1895861 RepID=UPI00095FFCCB|nr:GGDEF domain-containing protein [Thiobacillus sp. 65-1402]OJW94590.1 MAG: GGDEF domain-containing protein [Thiobacillus sp. 65-1402]
MSHTSVLRFGLILAAALVLLAGLATFAIYQSRPQAQPAQEEFGKPVMAAQIEFLAEAMQRSAARIAAHPQTLACFAGAAPEVCQAQAANLYALNQDATVLFVTDGQRQLLPGFLPGDARRLLASNAGRGGTGATATATFNLSLSHPVVDSDGKRLGVVIVEQSVPQLQALFDTLPLPDAAAYAELQQSLPGDASVVLMRRGNQAIKRHAQPTQIALAGTPWQIAVWRPVTPVVESVAPYALGWLVASLVIAILVMATVLAVRNRVSDNLRMLVKFTNDLRQQRLRTHYPVSLAEFQTPLETMQKLGRVMLGRQKEATSLARIDHLSQVNNRRSFDEKQKELFASLKDGWSHSLLILDIDNFKQVNDTFGHEAGDQLIIKFGNALKACLRNSDFIARLGGDEFCVLFPYTPLDRAQELAERLRANMPESVELIPGVTQKLSWSGGLSEYSRDDKEENEALARADAALLEAKRGGRNATRIRAAA